MWNRRPFVKGIGNPEATPAVPANGFSAGIKGFARW
jgi:hypothetical protein